MQTRKFQQKYIVVKVKICIFGVCGGYKVKDENL